MALSDRAAMVDGAYVRIEERAQAWASAEADVRAAIVLGSRAREDHPADEWADLDVLVVTTDPQRWCADRSWLSAIGTPWITFVDRAAGGSVRELRVMFEGGFDVDLPLMTPEEVAGLNETDPQTAAIAFGRGCRILVDKDGLMARTLAGLPADSRRATQARPDAEEYRETCSDFWYHTVWTVKHLVRGETWWAKSCCDSYLKQLLQRVLEWQAAAEGRDPWFRGRFLEEWADPDTHAGLHQAYAGYEPAEIRAALAVTMDLFGDLARRTARLLDVPYDEEAETHARTVVARIHETGSFVE